MPYQIIRNDITRVKADVIVNTANPHPVIGRGTDSAIYAAAGEKQLLAARKEIGDIARGEAAVTPAFNLPAKYIIHTVGPSWEGGDHGERDILHACYRNSLRKAAELKAESIAFPLIATGVYGFPKDEALKIAMAEIQGFVLEHDINISFILNKWDYHGIIKPQHREVESMPQIIPIKDLKDTSGVSELCHSLKEPIYITKNGYGDMVLMSMELFEEQRKKWEMYSDIELSEEQIAQGKTKNAKEALAAVRAKYGL